MNEWLEAVELLCRSGFNPDQHSTGGAQLAVIDDETGEIIYRQPIARQIRHEQDESVLWVRQIIGPGPSFDPNSSRRRSLPTTHVRVRDGSVSFEIPGGQTAIISAAVDDQIPVLDAWDTWKLTQLTAEQEIALEALEDDAWWW
ncbi:hypothetical protein [Mycobacteroides abscessus]|uniref:hypothetical protein n=1 Tax=Mycobacteroides abscessus TaxID=36809 RepID=UPI0009A5E3AF|nr:hypothetical protein [Mycobacteroides abscessus]SKK36757.1 Uncharacterised protein [Mycobacteroides abscessus subsp. abscessus]